MSGFSNAGHPGLLIQANFLAALTELEEI